MSRRQHTLASVGRIRIVSLLAACGLLLAAIAWPIPSHAENTTYYVTNAQGTVVAEMDTSSNVTYDATYRPYGQQQIGTPQASARLRFFQLSRSPPASSCRGGKNQI